MTTIETFFFRDKIPFEHFQGCHHTAGVPCHPRRAPAPADLVRRRRVDGPGALIRSQYDQRDGPSSPDGDRDLATDLSVEVLGKRAGRPLQPVRGSTGLPTRYLMKHFSRDTPRTVGNRPGDPSGPFGRVNRIWNFAQLGPHLDIVFCRNVLIYFDQRRKSTFSSGCASIGAGRLPGARRGGNSRRIDRPLSADRGASWTVCAEPLCA